MSNISDICNEWLEQISNGRAPGSIIRILAVGCPAAVTECLSGEGRIVYEADISNIPEDGAFDLAVAFIPGGDEGIFPDVLRYALLLAQGGVLILASQGGGEDTLDKMTGAVRAARLLPERRGIYGGTAVLSARRI